MPASSEKPIVRAEPTFVYVYVSTPAALRDPVAADLAGLRARREALDAMIVAWVDTLDEADLARPLAYRRVSGEAERKPLGPLMLHFFNHQTPHRGQATTLFSQAGVDVGVTDLLVLIPSVA